MGKKFEKMIFKGKPQNWQEACVFKTAKKITKELKSNVKADDFYSSGLSAKRQHSIDRNLLGRNVASVIAEAVNECKERNETTYNKWLKKEDFGHLTYSGLIPIQDVTKSLKANLAFVKNLDINKEAIDIQSLKADWKANFKNKQKKAKYWLKNRYLHFPIYSKTINKL